MPSYLVTGASRGIGFAFLRHLSANPDNVVVGLVRDKASTEKKVAAELNRPNIHIVQGDLANWQSLKKSVDEVSPIVNGALDYLIANGAIISKWSQYNATAELLVTDPQKWEEDMLETFQTNVVGNIQLISFYMPLVLKGKAKKVVVLSSGMADLDLIRDHNLALGAAYTISKAAVNAAVAKFHAEFSDRGVLFLSVCPGVVDTGVTEGATEEQMKAVMTQAAAFAKYAPTWKGPLPPAESVEKILGVVEKASLEEGYGGQFISHRGRGEKWIG